MQYAITKSEVRWFISDPELDHLFHDFDLERVVGAIKVYGTAKHGYTFQPIVYRSDNDHRNPLIVKIPCGDSMLYSFVTPFDLIKINPTFASSLPQTGEIESVPTSSRHLVVDFAKIIPQKSKQNAEEVTSSTKIPEKPAEISAENLQEKSEEKSTEIFVENSQDLPENIELAKLLVESINNYLSHDKTINALADDNGKVIKFLKVSKKRVTI